MECRIEGLINRSEISEKVIESYLCKRAKKYGLLCLKYFSASNTGYPDRLICFPGGFVAWVELKSKGRKPTKLQRIRHAELERLGHKVWVIDSKPGVDNFFKTFGYEI